MTPEGITRKIVDAVREEETLLVRGYSGRGMFGRSCLGITIDRNRDMIKVGALLQRALGNNDSIEELADSSLTDTMGHGMIVYFPSLPSPEY